VAYGHPNAIADVVRVRRVLDFRGMIQRMKNGRARMKQPLRNCRPLVFCLGMGLLTGLDNNLADAGSTFGQTQSSVTPAGSPYGSFLGSAV
jgi:hypothetical protein